MLHKPKGTHLASLVDYLWQSPNRAILVEQLVANLNDVDMFILAGWDTAATFGPMTGKLILTLPQTIQVSDDLDKVFMMATLVETTKAIDQPCLIAYRGTHLSVVLDKSSPNAPTSQVTHDPKGLLLALQLIRDHLDSVLLKPRELRDQEIAEFASSSGLEDDHFRRLVSWSHTITSYLQDQGV